MASRIQGITVEIGGDTTKLQTALKGLVRYRIFQGNTFPPKQKYFPRKGKEEFP